MLKMQSGNSQFPAAAGTFTPVLAAVNMMLMQVHYCNRQCQLAAHPIHKHYCLQPGLRQYSHKTRVRPINSNAANRPPWQIPKPRTITVS